MHMHCHSNICFRRNHAHWVTAPVTAVENTVHEACVEVRHLPLDMPALVAIHSMPMAPVHAHFTHNEYHLLCQTTKHRFELTTLKVHGGKKSYSVAHWLSTTTHYRPLPIIDHYVERHVNGNYKRIRSTAYFPLMGSCRWFWGEWY